LQEAIKSFAKVLQIDESNVRGLVGIASIMEQKGSYEHAVLLMENVLALVNSSKKSNLSILFKLGQL